MAEETKFGKEHPAEPPPETNPSGDDEQGEGKWAALHYASNRGHSKAVEILLEHKANVHLANDDQQTALHLASKKGNENVAKMLLNANADIHAEDKNGETALHLASGAKPKDRSEQGVDEPGPDDISADEKGMIQFSSGQHAASVVELLLTKGAKPGTKNKKGETALHLAAARGDQPDWNSF
ncbi:hypothetical protein NCS52_00751900 [Fusarium sp. LHS14.1]|nr:hypothetical protein NCS52_00751900 [Fusarium sp. LHS14.1]